MSNWKFIVHVLEKLKRFVKGLIGGKAIYSTRLYRFLPSRVQEAVKDGGQEIVKISVFTLIRVITFNVRVKNRALRSWRR